VCSSDLCAVCHSDVAGQHAVTVMEVSDGRAELDGATGGLVITFNVKENGVINNNDQTLYRAYVNYVNPELPTDPPRLTSNVRVTLTSDVEFATPADGKYTVTVPAEKVVADATYLIVLKSLDGSEPAITVKYGNAVLRDLVSNEGCAKCHGASPSTEFGHYLVGGAECQVCHAINGRNADSYTETEVDGVWENQGITGVGSNFTEYIHGIHNSHNMPSETYVRSIDDTGKPRTSWSIGFPSAMNNCSVCHTTPAQLETAATAPVSFYLCMSCHQTWDGFIDHSGDKVFAADSFLSFHRGMNNDTDCMMCHSQSAAIDEAADFHDFFASTDAHYNSIYRGEDISFANPNDVDFAVTGVTKTGEDVSFTWTASKKGEAVNPCNTTITSGPTFQLLGAYLAYAKGDDWVNEGVGTAPGQPLGAKNLFTALSTTCEGTVATTTGLKVSPAATYAEKALLAIGGKPLDRHATAGKDFFVRVASPTYAFKMTDGSPVTARRDIVDSAKCTGCHQGTMYQHGGDRIDNAQLCVVCHNPASSDKNNRVVTFAITNADGTVNTDMTYDGKNAESYDLRVLLHAIHGVSMRDQPYVVYRSRGIYTFVTDGTELPTGWPEDGKTIYGSTNDKTIAHNRIVVHYPQSVKNCEACHNSGTYGAADQTKAVALTVDAGTSWPDQSDDIVIGPSAAACTSCHYSTAVKAHAETFGYKAQVTKDAMLEAAK